MAGKIRLPSCRIVEKWKERHVIKWLNMVNLEDCIIPFENRHIDGPILLELTEQKLFTFQDVKIKHRSQIAKCVKDCKTQASNARRIVGSAKNSQEKTSSHTNGTCDSDYDDDFLEWDTDFEDDCEDDVKDQNTLKEPNNNTIQGHIPDPDVQEKKPPLEPNNPVARVTYIPKPPDLPLIKKSPTSNGQQSIPLRSNSSRPPIKRPPSQPPPPPVPQVSSNQDEPQEDYEVPINPSSSLNLCTWVINKTTSVTISPNPIPIVSPGSSTEISSPRSLQCAQECHSFSSETYEIIETPEENYEIVDDDKWRSSSISVSSDKPTLPPRLPQSTCGSPPPPPLPQKPRKLQDNPHILKGENFHSLTRPKLPSKIEAETVADNPGTVGAGILNSLRGRKYSATPNSSPKLHHYVKDVSGSDPAILSSVSSSTDHHSRSSTPDKEASLAGSKALSISMSSVISELKSSCAPPPPLPPRIPSTTAEDIAQSMATRPLPPVPATAASSESEVLSQREEDIHVQPWFHEIERQAAERLILDLNLNGAFVVRPSKRAGKENPFTLTMLHDEKIFHLNIRQRGDGMFALGKEKKKEKAFHHVAELITYHQTEPIILTSRGESAGQTILIRTPSKQ